MLINSFHARKCVYVGLIVACTIAAINLLAYVAYKSNRCSRIQQQRANSNELLTMLDDSSIMDFEGFDNYDENQPLIVPNVVHLIYLNMNTLRFHEMICIYSIYLNQRPDAIVIHCENCGFTGYFWQQIERVEGLRRIIRFNQLPVRRTIFGQIGPWPLHHRSDFWRIMIMMEYGGIYLDNDVYVINSLDRYRRFEMSVGFETMSDAVMGSQVLVAHRNARFLKAWFDTYRTGYKLDEWYTNAGHVPGQIVRNYPFIAHVEPFRFGVFIGSVYLYRGEVNSWKRDFDTWHLLINHRSSMDADNYALYPEFDEENVWKIKNVTFCAMARDVLVRIKNEI